MSFKLAHHYYHCDLLFNRMIKYAGPAAMAAAVEEKTQEQVSWKENRRRAEAEGQIQPSPSVEWRRGEQQVVQMSLSTVDQWRGLALVDPFSIQADN